MLKDYYNEIIPPWDSRYGKLGHLYHRLNINNYKIGFSTNSFYVIPEELVIINIDRYTGRGNHVYINNKSDYACPCNSFSRLLNESCKLSVQDYYDLVILHNNYIINRPRCKLCHNPLDFCGRFQQAYGIFCNDSCSAIFMQSHPEYSPAVAANRIANYKPTKEQLIYNNYRSTLLMNKPDSKCYLYLAKISDGYKFGISSNLEIRKSYSKLDGWNYSDIFSLLESTRLEVCNIEALLKISF